MTWIWNTCDKKSLNTKCSPNIIWKGLYMLATLFSLDASCQCFVPTRQIEGKVVEISRLQEIFAEKVLHQVSWVPSVSHRQSVKCTVHCCTQTYCPSYSSWQEAEIDNIHQLVVGATENVKEGNEDIREVPFTALGEKHTSASNILAVHSPVTLLDTPC